MLFILNHLFSLLIYGQHILMELDRVEDNRMRKKRNLYQSLLCIIRTSVHEIFISVSYVSLIVVD